MKVTGQKELENPEGTRKTILNNRIKKRKPKGLKHILLSKTLVHCDLCEYVSQTQLQHQVHKIVQHKESLSCPFDGCKFESNYKEIMEKHFEHAHKINVGLEQWLNDSEEEENEDTQVGNDIETISVDQNEAVDKTDDSLDGDLLPCASCSYEAPDEFLLKVHEALEHIEKGEDFSCPHDDCVFTPKRRKTLERHLLRVHGVDVMEDSENESFAVKRIEDEPDYYESDPDSPNPLSEVLSYNGVFKFCNVRYFCPTRHCLMYTDDMNELTNHLVHIHNKKVIDIGNKKVLWAVACEQCEFQGRDADEFREHFEANHDMDSVASNNIQSSGVCLSCTVCSYNTDNVVKAKSHGATHGYPNVEFIQHETGLPDQFVMFRYQNNSSIIISPDEESSIFAEKSALRLKCQNPGCNFNCEYNIGKMKRHMTVCRFKPDQNRPKTFTYVCTLCTANLRCRSSLKRHAYVHARDEGRLDSFTIKYQICSEGNRVGIETTKIDSSYVPRKSSNLAKYSNNSTSNNNDFPYAGYDPTKPVFSCGECNFKSNNQDELTKHKKLHWSQEKEQAFQKENFVFCPFCSFHCSDEETLNEHTLNEHIITTKNNATKSFSA